MLRRGMMAAAGAPSAVTWNPSDKDYRIALSGGNLVASRSDGSQLYTSVRATLARSAANVGGFYFEVVITTATIQNYVMVGVANTLQSLTSYIGNAANGWGYYEETGAKYTAGSSSAYGASYATGDVIGVLLKNGKLYFRKNGVWQNSADVDAETGAAFSGLSGNLFPAASLYNPSHILTGRFAADSFSGSIPSGAAAWES